MSTRRRVKLLIDTSSSWGRDLIRGISVYAKQRGGWAIDLEYRGRFETMRLPPAWQGDGIIARVTTPAIAEEIIASGLPAVNVSWYSHGSPQIPRCTNNEASFGRLMGEYLLRRGFRSFAYCGIGQGHGPGYADRVKATFADTLAAAGFKLTTWREPGREPGDDSRAGLARWLAALTRPVGVAVWGDHVGRRVAEACEIAGLAIPDEVAIISAEYDELMNALSQPPLTTVDYLADRVGYEAAALLDRMMQGEAPPAESIAIEPLGVITRQSTETLAVADARVVAALNFIRRNLHQPIQVSHLLKELGVARRGLEQQFRKLLGRSIAEEIRRVRLDQARQMFAIRSNPSMTIAAACGFPHPEVLTRNFRREFGLSPSGFRRQHRIAEDHDERGLLVNRSKPQSA